MTADIRFDGKALRPTSEVPLFPWLVKLVTLVRVTPDGVVTQAKSDTEKRTILGEADEQDLVLAAWPGEWSQDVFVVNDLKGARVPLDCHGTRPPRRRLPHLTVARLPSGTTSLQLGYGNAWQSLRA